MMMMQQARERKTKLLYLYFNSISRMSVSRVSGSAKAFSYRLPWLAVELVLMHFEGAFHGRETSVTKQMPRGTAALCRRENTMAHGFWYVVW